MDYISTRAAAKKWGISPGRVAELCRLQRISGCKKPGNQWLIPSNARKPQDARDSSAQAAPPIMLRPFLKWAGGKGQLLSQIGKSLPKGLGHTITKYAEPFVGGGAVLFYILSRYSLREIYISDVNAELINTYRVVQQQPEALIQELYRMQAGYHPLDPGQRASYYQQKRDRYNQLKAMPREGISIELGALFIFLNRTCFNGLYRVNRQGGFNVPMGAYRMPAICDEENLRSLSQALRGVQIVCGDYRASQQFIDSNTFVYFDPPYRPLNQTSSFTSYSEQEFGDEAQIQLAQYFSQLDQLGAQVLLSNSDPKNTNAQDNFFEELYQGFCIRRVWANRMINSKQEARGPVSELLIANYKIPRPRR